MQIKDNNGGFSLVELIVAISVGMIVSATIGGLIVYSMRMYRNESVKVNLQYEVQTNMNQIRDSIMSANWMEATQSSGITDSASFGNIKDEEDKWIYDGVVLVCDKAPVASGGVAEYYSLYLNRVHYETGKSIAELDAEIASSISDITSSRDIYLLGEHIESFNLSLADGCFDTATSEYINPVAVNVEIVFEDKKWNYHEESDGTKHNNITKRVNEVVEMRNYVSNDITCNGVTYSLKD